MTRWILALAMSFGAAIGLLIGLLLSGRSTPPARTVVEGTPPGQAVQAPAAPHTPAQPGHDSGRSALLPRLSAAPSTASLTTLPSFADVAERLNPAVVSIEATLPGTERRRRPSSRIDPNDRDPFGAPPDRNRPQRGAGTGFLIDAEGFVLTNHHVVDGAERITVGLVDGRRFKATRVGADPDTDVALLKVDSARPLPFATLGNSDRLRVGEWVVAIGNPLAYDHTLTVGVVSFLGRKLFDSALDRYIQTDAAITFGNSGGPLINAAGEVVGINTALSSRAASIGFAVPINQATAVLPQLKLHGTVSRGYMGLMLRALDSDLQAWLGLPSPRGAVVQDVAAGSPGARAGVRTYDVVVGVDGRPVLDHDALIQTIAGRDPGTLATLEIVREGRSLWIPVKLAQRPQRKAETDADSPPPSKPATLRPLGLGLSVRELDGPSATRLGLPAGVRGLFISRVDASSPAFDADISRGDVILEINRQPVRSSADFTRLTAPLRTGDVVAIYVYRPELDQRLLHTVRVE
jgi:serine protease Do